MPKTNPDFFNPNAMPKDFKFVEDKLGRKDFYLESALFSEAEMDRGVKFEDIDWKVRDARKAKIKQLVSDVESEFNAKYQAALAIIANLDPTDLIGKIYTRPPLMPKVEYKVASQITEGYGLLIPNKIGGIPDLRRHWLMKYRNKESGNRTVQEMVEDIWPRDIDGTFLSCMGTIDMGIYMYLMSQVTMAPSTFADHEHINESYNGDMAFFAPWNPGFDNRLDACVIKLEKEYHGISEEEYMQALKNLGIITDDKPNKEDGEEYGTINPNQYYLVENPTIGFDIELYSNDYGDGVNIVPKKYKSALSKLADTFNDYSWSSRKDDNNPFASNGNLTFGGAPTSQQTPKRYMDVNPYPIPCRMTPFVGFSSPAADMNYQIYTPRWPAQESASSTFYGKVDASCT